jgi:murein DD-endopeptidase MepM/ murein hydrolase activator NlpD
LKQQDEAGRLKRQMSWLEKAKAKLEAKAVRFLAAGMVVVLAGSIGYYSLTKPNAYAVMIDGQQVAFVTEETEAVTIIEELLGEKRTFGPVRYVEEVTFQPVRIKSHEFTAESTLKQTLAANLSFVSESTAIIIDGKEVGIVPNLATAENMLSSIKEKYLPAEKEGLTLETIAFEEDIVFQPKETSVDSFSDVDALTELLLHGTEKMETYHVQEGDSLWTIARSNGMTVEELKAANPQLKSELLSIGQELKLVKAEPLLHLVTTYSLTKEENIPYKTKYESDSNMYRGQERLKKPGVAGQRSVQYRIVERNGNEVAKDLLTEKVLKEPEDRIVIRGTKTMIASRGDGGSGQLAWPIRGTISSSYGKRGRDFHSGLDVSAPKGTPIGAAEAGTVIFAGRSGNYGLMVTIDHGNGLTTRYAHCSELKVKVGDQVTRGQVIGLVGTTGRATGPHVHFEVRVNGNHKNPINYLK